MKSRTQPSDDGSLDLLLDTICNTFGGVMLICLLVAVLLNFTSGEAAITPPTAESHENLVNQQRLLNQLNKRLIELEQIRDELERDPIDEAIVELVQSMEKSEAELFQMDRIRNRLLDELSASQIVINESAMEMSKLKRIQEELKAEVERRTRTSRPPKSRETNKTAIVAFLRDGRLSFYTSVNAAGKLAMNKAETRYVAGKQGVEPIPGKGTSVNHEAQEQIKNRLRAFDSSRFFIDVMIWEDSFDSFQVLREAITDQNLEYGLSILNDDEFVSIGRTPGPRRVQN